MTEQEQYDLWEGRAATIRLLTNLLRQTNDVLDSLELDDIPDAVALLNETRTQIITHLYA